MARMLTGRDAPISLFSLLPPVFVLLRTVVEGRRPFGRWWVVGHRVQGAGEAEEEGLQSLVLAVMAAAVDIGDRKRHGEWAGQTG